MESDDTLYYKMDTAFDKCLADMKPHVLHLPHKSERQRCAVWIKKLCEPTVGITGRKNRNMYAELMVRMLKKSVLEGPFTTKPDYGPLPPLPTYTSIYFDEPGGGDIGKNDDLPDWVAGELVDSVGSSVFRSQPAASSTWRSTADRTTDHSYISPRRHLRPHTSLGLTLDKDPDLSPVKHYPHTDKYSADDMHIDAKKHVNTQRFLSDDGDTTHDARRQIDFDLADSTKNETTDINRPMLTSALSNVSSMKASLYKDDPSLAKLHDREIELRTKMAEAKFHEEKLKLQQKHDSAVQKILDRKNAEIEEVKSHYRTKAKELEETVGKLERKIQSLVKESTTVRESKDKQITELKKLVEESNDTKKYEYEKKVSDLIADFEQEKFDMQKLHTRNIQELVDETNGRLQKMENEYNSQLSSTSVVIKELETRMQQLIDEAEITHKAKNKLEQERTDLVTKNERMIIDMDETKEKLNAAEKYYQNTLDKHETEIRALKNKCEASLEFLKQEHTLAASKATDTISDLEQHIDNLKKAIRDTEEEKKRQLREMEQVHQQDKIHIENLHDKQVRALKNEMEQFEHDAQKRIQKLEEQQRAKEEEMKKLQDEKKQQAVQADKALAEFKTQVEKNQTLMYDEMKKQMERVESDLNRSKQMREKQVKEFQRLSGETHSQHQQEITELKMAFEQEKAVLLKDFQMQKDMLHSEHTRDVESFREMGKLESQELQVKLNDLQTRNTKTIENLEQQVRELQEENIQANQLRKQQLVELGLLRDEEKQKMRREHENEMSKLHSATEQQKLEQQKAHSTEMEKMLETMNQRLKDIENEYTERNRKSTEIITDLHQTINSLRDDIKRTRGDADTKIADIQTKQAMDKKTLKQHYSSNLESLQGQLERQHDKVKNLERQIQKQEADYEEKITHLRLGHEEKMRGFIPASIRQELEDTIESLRSQVTSMQQRIAVLQEEIEMKAKYAVSFATSSPIKSSA